MRARTRNVRDCGDGVVERVGMAGFNKVFDSPLTLPRLDELGDPDAWVTRVHGPQPAIGG